MLLLLALAFPRQAKTSLQVMLVKGSDHLLVQNSSSCISQAKAQAGRVFSGLVGNLLQYSNAHSSLAVERLLVTKGLSSAPSRPLA